MIDVLAILFVAGVLAVGFAVAPLHHGHAAAVLAGELCLVAPSEGHQGRVGRRAPEKGSIFTSELGASPPIRVSLKSPLVRSK